MNDYSITIFISCILFTYFPHQLLHAPVLSHPQHTSGLLFLRSTGPSNIHIIFVRGWLKTPEKVMEFPTKHLHLQFHEVGVEITFTLNNNQNHNNDNDDNNPHLNFLKGTALGVKEQGLRIRHKV